MTPIRHQFPWFAVLTLTVTAFALRAFHLNAQSLWYDEIGSAQVVSLPLASVGGVPGGARVEPTAWLSTGYYAILKIATWPGVAERDTILRWTSAVLGTATIPALAWALLPILSSDVVLASTAVLATSPFHVWYSQEVRPYVLLLLASTLAVGAYLRARSGSGVGWWAAVTVLVTIALYTHPVALAVPAIMTLDLLAEARTDVRRAAAGFGALAAAGFLFLPALWLMHIHGANNPADLRPVSLLDVPYAIYAFCVGFSWGPSTTELHYDVGASLRASLLPILTAAGVFGTLGLLGLRTWGGLEPRSRRLLAAWFIVPLGLAFGIASVTANPFNVRYGIVSFPAVAVVLALGATTGGWRPTTALLAAGATAISLASVANLAFDPRYAKEDCRGLAAALGVHASADDLVLVNATYMAAAVSYYYPGPAKVTAYPVHDLPPGTDLRTKGDDLADVTRGRSHVWLVATRTFHGDAEGVLPRMLARDRLADLTITVPGIVATRYSIPSRD